MNSQAILILPLSIISGPLSIILLDCRLVCRLERVFQFWARVLLEYVGE